MTGTKRPQGLISTLVFAVVCVLGLAVLWVVIENLHTDRPTTLKSVQSEATTGLDKLQASLPAAAIVSASDEFEISPCPDRSGGDQVGIIRTIRLAPDFDQTGWIRTLSADYAAKEGWHANLRALGTHSDANLESKIVGPPLIIYTVTTAGEPEGPLVMRSTSRCTAPSPTPAPAPTPTH